MELYSINVKKKAMIRRVALKKLKELAKGFPIVAVVGPRQSGKTTLTQEAFKNHSYLSLEDLDVRDEAREDPRGFLSRQQGDFILDEVQHVPELFNYLQTYVDQDKQMGRVVLTGSQNFLLMEQISQSLAGRVGLLPLLPFSWPELKNVTDSNKPLNDVVFTGSYPPIFDRGVTPVDWYPRYVQTYIDRDVRLIRNIGDLSSFQRFVKLCAGRIGQLVNFSSLATDCGIDTKTAQSWISVLEASYIILLLRPHYKNFNKRLVKQPKLYFLDTGVACTLLGIESADQLSTHYLRGGLFENWVILERLKKRFNAGLNSNLFFWRDNTGHEIDLLEENGQTLHAWEIKAGETFHSDWMKGLKWFQKVAEPNPQLTIVYGGDRSTTRMGVPIRSWRELD
jgi:uncharacterized protein